MNKLQKRLQKLLSRRSNLSNRREPSIRKRLQELDKQIALLEAEIKGLDSSALQVSDHAILRYIERVQGINVEQLKKQILTDELKAMVEQLGGNGQFPIGNALVRVRDYVIVTVIVKGENV